VSLLLPLPLLLLPLLLDKEHDEPCEEAKSISDSGGTISAAAIAVGSISGAGAFLVESMNEEGGASSSSALVAAAAASRSRLIRGRNGVRVPANRLAMLPPLALLLMALLKPLLFALVAVPPPAARLMAVPGPEEAVELPKPPSLALAFFFLLAVP
jgi:hypothetical protein